MSGPDPAHIHDFYWVQEPDPWKALPGEVGCRSCDLNVRFAPPDEGDMERVTRLLQDRGLV